MPKAIGYGVSVRNTKEKAVEKDQTIPKQELESLGYYGDGAVVEIVRSCDSERPMLDEIVEEYTSEDLIVLYSINTLFKGKNNKGLEYYSKIINKGIRLLICDFSGSVARISKYSTVSSSGKPYQVDKDSLISQLEQDIPTVSAIVGKKIKGNLVFDTGLENDNGLTSRKIKAFQDIYFAYEAYQLELEDTLALLKKYCGISTKVTFWRLAADFERSFAYTDELDNYCRTHGRTILDYPKRCGGVPNEFYEINEFMNSLADDIPKSKKLEYAIEELRLSINKDVYKRWEMADAKMKKPRRPVTEFDMDRFEKNHQPIQ